MPTDTLRVSIPVPSFPRPTSTAPRSAGRRMIGTLVGVWAVAAAVVVAVVVAVIWDLRR